MMLRINQLKLPISHTEEDLKRKAAKLLRIPPSRMLELHIIKQSIDARKKPELFYVYTVDVKVAEEGAILKKRREIRLQFLRKSNTTFQAPANNHAKIVR